MALQEWEQKVQPATDKLVHVGRLVFDDLDEQRGGVGWWHEMLDWKRIVLLSDYLLQSIDGSVTSLARASYAAVEHRGIQNAMDYEIVKKIRAGLMPYPDQTPTERKQQLRREMTIEQVLYHLCQCLDRLAAAVLIVGAVNVRNVVKADWSTVENVLETPDGPKPGSGLRAASKAPLMPTGTPGRALQDALLEPVRDTNLFGPRDWLPWMRETRNAATHRADSTKMLLLKGQPGSPEGLHRGLPRVPKLSDVETFVHAPTSGRALEKVVLAKGTPATLEGLTESTASLAAALADSMAECWLNWKASPPSLTAPGQQWRVIEPPPPLHFEGYGPNVNVLLGPGAEVRVHPSTGKRLRAALILDAAGGQNRWEREP
ncbi:hypothetical protein [Terracoccus sp. 273MFTsu3.1]|uniref:hypothetical protein n=1 Tax=Terracoccus sp. 273MFTsu3.1 TaxID=1172188 RepID=UPI0012DC2C7C|nr:hypothetical protein [Terracoccus sp. 273MFTsu3.1]